LSIFIYDSCVDPARCGRDFATTPYFIFSRGVYTSGAILSPATNSMRGIVRKRARAAK